MRSIHPDCKFTLITARVQSLMAITNLELKLFGRKLKNVINLVALYIRFKKKSKKRLHLIRHMFQVMAK